MDSRFRGNDRLCLLESTRRVLAFKAGLRVSMAGGHVQEPASFSPGSATAVRQAEAPRTSTTAGAAIRVDLGQFTSGKTR